MWIYIFPLEIRSLSHFSPLRDQNSNPIFCHLLVSLCWKSYPTPALTSSHPPFSALSSSPSSSSSSSSPSHSLLLGWRMSDAVITSGSQTGPCSWRVAANAMWHSQQYLVSPAPSTFHIAQRGLERPLCLSVCVNVCVAVGGNRADVRKECERRCVHPETTETCHIDFHWFNIACVWVCVCENVPYDKYLCVCASREPTPSRSTVHVL